MRRTIGLIAVLCLLVGCDDGTGTPGEDVDVSVLLEAEDTITEGLAPGEGPEAIRDGWAVTFDDYVVVIGDVDAHLSTDDSVQVEAPERFAVDLVDVPQSGLELWTLSGLREGRWELNYAIAGAADGAMPHDSVTDAQMTRMIDEDLTYLIAGSMTQPGGRSCPPANLAAPGVAEPSGEPNAADDPCYANETIAFELGVQAETAFGPCEVDEMPGFAVTAGSTTTIALTIHGDHIFFNGFPESDEGGTQRLAQWLADCDLNLDGEVTREELEQIAPSDLIELDERFQLGGSPITPLTNLWDYVTAQLKTQGHFQGEGECPFDGVAHDH